MLSRVCTIRNFASRHKRCGVNAARATIACRFEIKTKLLKAPTHIQYSIHIAGLEAVPSGKIPLAAAHENWHVAAYSCNDQRQLPQVRWSGVELRGRRLAA